MRDVITVAHLTLVEARRRRIVLAGAVCALAFLTVFSVAVVFANREMSADPKTSFVERQGTLTAMMIVGFMAANFLSVIFAILLPVDTLSGEIDSGVMQTLASKPIDRAQIVLGKWAGHLLLALAYLLALCAGILLVIRVVAGLAPAGAAVALPLLMLEVPSAVSDGVSGRRRALQDRDERDRGSRHLRGLVHRRLRRADLVSFAGISSMRTIGVLVSLVSPADSMWRLAAHYMEPEVMRSTGMLALGAAVPTAPMVWWAAGYTVLTLLYAIAAFRRRAL